METNNPDHIRPIDQAVLDVLRQNPSLSVQELTELLEVTATAVRQRLERLVQVELVGRRKESTGRGRPQFRYSLTPLGMRYASASYADLAAALWQEIMELPNPLQRKRVLRRVAKRMGQDLKVAIPEGSDLAQRFSAMATALGRRKVPVALHGSGDLPILELHACPYPELTEHDESRQLCEMEQAMMSEAMGHSIQLDFCRLDGHQHCQFRPVG
ncbi:MAG: winged helix-turn-helix transcriptional regulator [Planctomycetales bacterium]|nr:winged helix-turn-helix transcriptional regulator [Planctomycetales bacterium]